MNNVIEKIFDECKKFFKTSVGIEILKEFGDGKSGNRVYLIEVIDSHEPKLNGKYVLKISLNDEKEFLKEIFNTVELGKYEESYNGICFPAYQTAGIVDNTLYYVYDVAGSELNNIIKLSGTMKSSESILEKISRELLLGWNEKFRNKKVTINDCIIQMLGDKSLEVNDKIEARISHLIGDSLAPAYLYQDNIYPNPYYFICNLHGPLKKLINGVIGKTHGDLNRNNIIVNKCFLNNNYEIYLIDYSHYKNESYLFFDHAYLQLNILLSSLSSVNVYEWCTDVNELLNNKSNLKKNKFIHYINNGIENFVKKCQSNNKESCILQYFCAQIAAGMNWMSKSASDETRQALCYLYSSIYLKKMLEILDFKIPYTPGVELTLLGGNKEREIWDKLDKFNTIDNRYILISPCDPKTIEKEKFRSFLGVKWEAVFHMAQNVNNEITKDFLPQLKTRYGIQFKSFPEITKNVDYEIAPTWCTVQIPNSGNMKIWYKREIQFQMNKLLKSVLSLRENEPIYIIADTTEWNYRIINELISDIQINVGNTPIYVLGLNNYDLHLEKDEYMQFEYIDYTLSDVALCASVILNEEKENRSVWLPKKSNNEKTRDKVYFKDEEVNYVSMDFEIISHVLGWYTEKGDAGEGFYRGTEPSWRDIAEHRDIDREDYINIWRNEIEDKLKNTGSNVVNSIYLFHRAGAGGTTLSRRILWDFHTKYPCLLMKKKQRETSERLKFVYDKTKLPVLIVVEISAGNINQVDIANMRIELINKGIRALFICVSRVNNINVKKYTNNFYLTSEVDMIMNQDECRNMFNSYSKMTSDSKALNNLSQLTWGDEEEWKDLRQPFFYGLFTFDKDYHSIAEFVRKSMVNADGDIHRLIMMLAFMTQYSQIGLKKREIENIFNIDLKDEERVEEILNNPLIVYKNIGYQICHPVIAEYILKENLESENKEEGLLKYSKEFIDMITGIYMSNSKRLNDILEEIFTHRVYYVDEEKYKFSNLIMEFNDANKRKIFEYLIEKLPNNPHYDNHLARVDIYPSEFDRYVTIDFDRAIQIASSAIKKSEILENEGVGIHHHLLGKIYTKQCKSIIVHSNNNISSENIWRRIKPIYEDAVIEFSKCMSGNNVTYGLIGKMELISGILNKISTKKRMSVNYIIRQEPRIKHDFIELIEKMHRFLTEYTMQGGEENAAYRIALQNFYKALGNIKEIEKQLHLNGLTLKERILTRRTLAALEIINNNRNGINFFELSETSLQKIYDLLSQNIREGAEVSKHDRITWLKTYMRMESFDVGKAYDFLMEWPEGERDYYVCFYRYVLGFILYYNGELDFLTVEKHLKQSNMLAHGLYGISITSTREMIGWDKDKIYLIPDSAESLMGQMNLEERERYRAENCKFFEGQISDFKNSTISIKFTIDDVHTFIAKIPAVDDISGMNVGDMVKFVLGFSYSEMRAWNVKKVIDME